MQNSEGRQRAGALGENNALDPDLIRNGDRVQPGRTAERDHHELARIDAFLEQRQTDRRAEVGVGDGK